MIGVTGSSGVLGQALLKVIRSQDLNAVPIFRRTNVEKNLYIWDLRDNVPNSFFDFDLIIHCAYSFKVARQKHFDVANLNIEGARRLAEWGKLYGKKVINISSVNAPLEMTKYGREKKIIENIFYEYGHFNLRLGIIDAIPPIGLVSNLLDKSRFIPRIMIDKDKEFFVSDLQEISNLIKIIYIEKKIFQNKNIYVVNKQKESLPHLIKRIKPNSKFLVISFKSKVLLLILSSLPSFKFFSMLHDQILSIFNSNLADIEYAKKEWIFSEDLL